MQPSDDFPELYGRISLMVYTGLNLFLPRIKVSDRTVIFMKQCNFINGHIKCPASKKEKDL